MPDELPDDDLKAIWHNQPTETSTMTLKLIRAKARDLHAKTRRQLLATAVGPLVTAFFYTFAIRQLPQIANLLHPLFLFALVWSLGGLYFLNRAMWSTVMPGDAGLSTGLAFCRGELERRRLLLRRILLWSFGPLLMTLATFILALAIAGGGGRRILSNGRPFLVLVVVWILAYFVLRARDQRELQREIDELDDIEK
ncbi:hypothetical protein [uncultured Paludibaculum sp.]|uniref:hypothetical protein n=1 Tax=uncultured Paludibaculum sp. TaxID=1765020 RepID=UPI002AABD9CF|nr:hypothetical protein [uncultured Paludibaculum sp.]